MRQFMAPNVYGLVYSALHYIIGDTFSNLKCTMYSRIIQLPLYSLAPN